MNKVYLTLFTELSSISVICIGYHENEKAILTGCKYFPFSDPGKYFANFPPWQISYSLFNVDIDTCAYEKNDVCVYLHDLAILS